MKNLIICILLCLFLQGCIATGGGIKYETSNTVVLDITNKPEKQTFNLFISARDKTQFEAIVNDIAKLLREWGKK